MLHARGPRVRGVSDRAARCLIRTLRAETELLDCNGTDGPLLRTAIMDVTDERAGFEAAPIGMLMIDPLLMRVLRVNDALCTILDRSRDELLGLKIHDLTHPDDRDALSQARRQLVDGAASTAQAEKRYLRPDGSVVWATIYITALRSPDGSIRAFSSQIIDITESKNLVADVQSARLESLGRLAVAGGYRDFETQEHTERVAGMSVPIGAGDARSAASTARAGGAAARHRQTRAAGCDPAQTRTTDPGRTPYHRNPCPNRRRHPLKQ